MTAFNPFRKTLGRLKSLTRGKPLGVRSEPKVCVDHPTSTRSLSSVECTTAGFQFLPEISFDSASLSDLIFDASEHVPAAAAVAQKIVPTAISVVHRPHPQPRPIPPAVPVPYSPTDAHREQNLQLIKWEFVNPTDLNPSPYSVAATDLTPAQTPLFVPSAAWLSRNVIDLEAYKTTQLITSSPALPILPRSLLPASSNRSSCTEADTPVEVSAISVYKSDQLSNSRVTFHRPERVFQPRSLLYRSSSF